MKKILLICGALLSLTGCFDNTSAVKDGIMDFNKTLTVGQAFDNWQNCSSRHWEDFETANGMAVVQFSCKLKDTNAYFRMLKEKLPEDTKKEHSLEGIDIKSITLIFQWTVNKDDTFQIYHIGEHYEWNDGKKHVYNHENFDYLKLAYDNSITYDLEGLKNTDVSDAMFIFPRILYAFNELRSQAQ